MEGSDAAAQAEQDQQVPAEGESADGSPVAVGQSGEDVSREQQPLADHEMHDPSKPGPSSAPDPSTLSGSPLDAATKAGLEGGPVPNAGEAVSVADQEAERQRQEAQQEAGQ